MDLAQSRSQRFTNSLKLNRLSLIPTEICKSSNTAKLIIFNMNRSEPSQSPEWSKRSFSYNKHSETKESLFVVSEKEIIDAEREDEEHDIQGLSYCGSMRFFCKHSCRDMFRHKVQFCLSFCSVFFVVLSVVVVNTIIAKGPLIFLALAESIESSYDGCFFQENM